MFVPEKNIRAFKGGLAHIIIPALERVLSSPAKENFLWIDAGKSGTEEQQSILIESLFPPPRLIIAGAGHIGKALCHLGRMLEFEVTVIDDRAEYANRANLPDAHHILVRNQEMAIAEKEPGEDTYVVIVTRGHNDDSVALKACIGGNARYIGMIGSKTKIAKMRRNFIDNRWATEEQWNKIHAPVGIEIKSQTVEEIAISIAAELVLARNSI
jgi:xanthine dehydrogenase accessory factor